MKRSNQHDGKAVAKGAVAAEPDRVRYGLRLFVTGTTPKSARAIRNIRAICDDNLPGQYDLEIIDIYQNPEYLVTEQIAVTPTLVKRYPLPLKKLIGDLSDTARVMAGLDILARPIPFAPAVARNAI